MNSDGSNDSAYYLSGEGPLSELLPRFSYRHQQERMAHAVEQALLESGTLVVEAGTGTGKTLAYLIPAALSGLRIIVSTGTRNLQEQLYYTDLPLIRKALGRSINAAMLKGRSNYLCPHRLELNLNTAQDRGRDFYAQLVLIRAWSSRTATGDIAEVTEVEENAPVWPSVTSTVDNCLGQECPRLHECPVYRARARANEADLVVVNHHLLFADLLLKEEGLGQVLPDADAFILDEAHQLPEIATRFFGITLSSRQLLDLGRDAVKEQLTIGRDDPELLRIAERYESSCLHLLRTLGSSQTNREWRESWLDPGVAEAVGDTRAHLDHLTGHLEQVAVRSKGLQSCANRGLRLRELFATLTGEEERLGDSDYVHWLESGERRFVIHLSPLRVAGQFSAILREKESAWIFTSATLAVGEQFDHFVETLGLEESSELLQLHSPFDFSKQAIFYLPEELPDPSDRSFTATVVARAIPVIELCAGRTFFLFTSHRALAEASQILARDGRFNCLVQGSMPKLELLRRFASTERSVLLATSSFWEGVDVRAADLSCVIIDKLPFMSPGDPVVGARLRAMDQGGRSGFNYYLLPLAAISLRQGFGRLIRDETDHGVFMLADQRLVTRAYGKQLRASLPEMDFTRSLADVKRFVARVVPGVEAG